MQRFWRPLRRLHPIRPKRLQSRPLVHLRHPCRPPVQRPLPHRWAAVVQTLQADQHRQPLQPLWRLQGKQAPRAVPLRPHRSSRLQRLARRLTRVNWPMPVLPVRRDLHRLRRRAPGCSLMPPPSRPSLQVPGQSRSNRRHCSRPRKLPVPPAPPHPPQRGAQRLWRRALKPFARRRRPIASRWPG